MRTAAHIAAFLSTLLATPVAFAAPRTVVLVEPSDGEQSSRDLASALSPHLESAEARLRIIIEIPPAGSDVARAAWGAEVAARERADAVLWLEEGEGGTLTLRLVDSRARVARVDAPAGDRFDQLRTVALAAGSQVTRMVARARAREAREVPTAEAPAPRRRIRLAPSVAAGPVIGSGSASLGGGGRLDLGLRVGSLIALSLGAELYAPEDVASGNGDGGTRVRLPIVLVVSGVVPLDPLELAAGIEGALTVASLSGATADRTRVAALLGLRAAARTGLGSGVFLEIPISFRLRLAAPGADDTWPAATVTPAFEAVLGLLLGIGG